MSATWSEFARRQDLAAEDEMVAGAEMFMGVPDRWYEASRWRCQNGHVSGSYLKSGRLGAVCLACFEPVRLTWPEDSEGAP